jgi:hypothetical protein
MFLFQFCLQIGIGKKEIKFPPVIIVVVFKSSQKKKKYREKMQKKTEIDKYLRLFDGNFFSLQVFVISILPFKKDHF